jgi:hypothetical protein
VQVTYSKGEKGKAKDYAYEADKRENPHGERRVACFNGDILLFSYSAVGIRSPGVPKFSRR